MRKISEHIVVRNIISTEVLMSTPKAVAKIMLSNMEGIPASIIHTFRGIPETPAIFP